MDENPLTNLGGDRLHELQGHGTREGRFSGESLSEGMGGDEMSVSELDIQPGERFSVYQFFEDDSYERVRFAVSIEEAKKAAKHYCTSVAARMRFTVRVIITDSGDCIVFEWKKDEGVVFPPNS